MLAELQLHGISRHNYLERHELSNCRYFTFVPNGEIHRWAALSVHIKGNRGERSGGISQARPRRDLRSEGPLPDEPDVELSG
jgi:hypothetical protein